MSQGLFALKEIGSDEFIPKVIKKEKSSNCHTTVSYVVPGVFSLQVESNVTCYF